MEIIKVPIHNIPKCTFILSKYKQCIYCGSICRQILVQRFTLMINVWTFIVPMCRCLSANTGNQIKPTFSVEIAEQERRTVVRQRPQHWRLKETRSVIIDFDLMNYCLVKCICQGTRTDPANDTVGVFFKTKGLVVPSLRNRRQTHWQNYIAFIHSLGVGSLRIDVHSKRKWIQHWHIVTSLQRSQFPSNTRQCTAVVTRRRQPWCAYDVSVWMGPWSGSVGDSRLHERT